MLLRPGNAGSNTFTDQKEVLAAALRQVSDEGGAEQCSFCGKRRHQVAAMASAGDTRICNECLESCDEIVSDVPPVPSR